MVTKARKGFGFFFIILLFLLLACKEDNTPPEITILGDNPKTYCINPEQPYADPGATALDDEDGDITANINTSSDVNETVPGTYYVTYTAKDKAGNSMTAKREVKVMFCK